MEIRTERTYEIREKLCKLEEQREELAMMQEDIFREELKQEDCIWDMERSIERMMERTLCSDVFVMEILEEKSALLKTMRRDMEDFREERIYEFHKKVQQLEDEQEELSAEMKRLCEEEDY